MRVHRHFNYVSISQGVIAFSPRVARACANDWHPNALSETFHLPKVAGKLFQFARNNLKANYFVNFLATDDENLHFFGNHMGLKAK